MGTSDLDSSDLFNISAFLWRVVKRALLVNDRIRSKGIQLASYCRCCEPPQDESIHHLFLQSASGRQVWDFFLPIFRFPDSFSFTTHALVHSLSTNTRLSQFEQARAAVVAYIFREI